ncbi:S-adenosyl-L-methionine-dependent methyltransferase [Halenospora varia]|nr:S-adenosyl-L-methionine-dependent methyltransferase [Halenospora varia]
MPFPSPVRAPQHILDLLSQLHQQSLKQEAAISPNGKFISTDNIGDAEDKQPAIARPDFDDLMRDKFIALDEDKCHFVYQLIGATGATNVVEAGTSYGVSTIYLALAVAQNNAALKRQGRVFATEKEPEKAAKAKEYWRKCGEQVEEVIDLRVGDLLETLKVGLPEIDLLLLDIWTPMALPTLKIVQQRMRHGAVVLADNTISGATGYKDLLEYLNAPDSGFQNMTVPFTNGFEMSVYLP